MKKITFLLVALAFAFFVNAQIDKKYVVVEVATGTWCTYCPGAANGVDDMVENGLDVAIIKNHGGDTFSNSGSNARNNYYNVEGFPTAVFNGGNAVVGGGGSTTSMYSSYLPKYNSAIAVQTSFDVTVEIIAISDIDYQATITIDKVADYAGENLVLQAVVIETDIEYNWQGMQYINFVNRQMYPNYSGTSLDFSGGDQIVQTINFSVDESWAIENCELVVFVQDNNSKEILNADKATMNIPIGSNNAMIYQINAPTDTIICGNSIFPEISIKNRGAENLTSLDIEYSVNDETSTTYNWTGDLAYGEIETIDLGELNFAPENENYFEVNLSSPNGASDDDLNNNTMTFNFKKSPETTTHLILDMATSNWGVSYDFQDTDGNILYSGGYGTFTENFHFSNLDQCYYFNVYNMFGKSGSKNDYWELRDSYGNIVMTFNDNIPEQQTISFVPVTLVNIDENLQETKVFPNPTSDFINVEFYSNAVNNVKIFDITGKIVYQNEFSNVDNAKIDCNQIPQGVYFLELSNGSEIFTEKITIVK